MLFNDLKGEQKKTSKRNLFLNDFKVNRKLGYLPFASFPEAAPTYYIILDSAKKKVITKSITSISFHCQMHRFQKPLPSCGKPICIIFLQWQHLVAPAAKPSASSSS